MDAYASLDHDRLKEAVHRSLSSWGEISSSEEELLSFLFLVKQKRIELDGKNKPSELRRATNEVLLDAIAELSEQEEREALILRYRFMEEKITRRVATKVHASIDQVNRWQRSAINNLTNIIDSKETSLRTKRRLEIESNLPAPPYAQFFGFNSLKNEILDQLLNPDGASVLAIVGIGGIGKTSLAHNTIREAINSLMFENIIWTRVAARRLSGEKREPEICYERLISDLSEKLWPGTPDASTAEMRRRIRTKLKQTPHIVVIDNLESEATTKLLLEHARELANPSKFLITSRCRPAISTPAYYISMGELPQSDAEDLLRFHAKAIGLTDLAEANANDFKSIYQLTGGNPLALKLVTSLASVLPLPDILAGLAGNQPGPIEDLYRFIFWESWRTLNQPAQSLLQAMPLVAESGALPEHLKMISTLGDMDFWPAVTELITRSLLEVRGTLHERRYGIHRLTETFLRTDIIRWEDGGS